MTQNPGGKRENINIFKHVEENQFLHGTKQIGIYICSIMSLCIKIKHNAYQGQQTERKKKMDRRYEQINHHIIELA